MPKRLVVYYSRRGATRIVAEALARELECGAEALVDTRNRTGRIGYWRSLFDGTFGRSTVLQPIAHDPAAYDLIVVGTPIWNSAVSAPVRTYLDLHAGRLPALAFFCTFGGTGSARAFRQMTRLAGRTPLAVLDVRRDTIEADRYRDRVGAFAESARTAGGRPSNR